MAENLLWTKRVFKDAKIFVWAHNGHVANYLPPPVWWLPMGQIVKRALGSDLFTLVFAFGHGGFQAVKMGAGVRHFTVKPGPAGSLDAALARTGIPMFALPWRQLPTGGVVASWLRQPQFTREIGSVFDPSHLGTYWTRQVAPREADALFFIDQVHAARPLDIVSKHKIWKPTNTAPVNLDFEASGGTPDAPIPGWNVPHRPGYQVRLVDRGCHGGRHCAALSSGAPTLISAYGALRQGLLRGNWAGKRVTVRAALRAKLTSPGSEAVLQLLARGYDGTEIHADTSGQPVGDGWTFKQVTLDVPAQAGFLEFGIALQGRGTVWLDDVSFREAPLPAAHVTSAPR